MKQNAILILRWIGILPASCIAYVLGYLLLMLMNWIGTRFYVSSDGDGGWMSLYIWPLIATGAASFYFVTLGAAIAPSNKKTVALILMILLCVVSGICFFSLTITRNYSIIAPAIAQIIGGVLAYNSDELSND